MKSTFRFLLVAVPAALVAFSASATWSIDDSDASHVLITDGNWTFDVGAKGSYPSFTGALKSISGFQLKAVVAVPTGAAAETLDFSTFKEDTRTTQGRDEPYGVTSSVLVGADLAGSGIRTFVGPDFVHIGTMFSANPTLESITVSSDFSDDTVDMLKAPTTPVLKTFSPTVLPNWKTIGKNAFLNQSALEGDFVFDNVSAVRQSTFSGASSITSLRFLALGGDGGNQAFMNMTALKSFYAPTCTKAGSSFFQGCSHLGEVTLSPNLSSFANSMFYNCTSLTNLTPRTFPLATMVEGMAFYNCSSLRGTLSLPEAASWNGGSYAFYCAALDEIDIPKMPLNGARSFASCPNLMKLTVLGNTGSFGASVLTPSSVGCVVDWLGDDVPTTIPNNAVRGGNSSPLTFCLHTKTAQDGWVAASWVTRTADQLTDADKAKSTYPGDAITLAYCEPAASGNSFWLTKYVERTTVTIVPPEGVEVAGAAQGGVPLTRKSDGTYEADAANTMEITYRATGDWIFADGTAEHVVADVAVAETIPASTCDLEAVVAAARIGETRYLTLQAAFDVGGDVTMIGDQSLTASATVAADKAVVIDLNGRTLTAAGITAFANAGSLEVANGTVMAGTLVDNTGTFVVRAGTYSEDVTQWCASGFHVVAQPTEPPTWKVVENVTHTLSLEESALAAQHLSGVALSCDGAFTCVTNAGVIVWSLPESLPYVLTYETAVGYLFDGTSRTKSVVNAEGLTADATVAPADIPVPGKHAYWVWDEQAKTLTDGNWTFNGVVKTADFGYEGLSIGSTTFVQADVAVSNVDFATCAETTGWPLIGIPADFRATLPVTKFVAPDLVRLGKFSDNKTIEEIVVSGDVRSLGASCFSGCSALRKFEPTHLPNLAFSKQLFVNCGKLTGDFEFDAWTVIGSGGDFDAPFQNCNKITSLRFPNLVSCSTMNEFVSMTSMTNFYAPKLTYLRSATLNGCSSLKTVVLSDDVGQIGINAFKSCSAIESFLPTTMPCLTNLGNNAFLGARLPADLDLPILPKLGEGVFRQCTGLTSVSAPMAELNGQNAFWLCSNLTNLTVKGGASLGGDQTLRDVCPNLIVHWLGKEIPAEIPSGTIRGSGNGRIVVCVHDPETLQRWLDTYATRLRKDFTDDDRANPTYPGRSAKGVDVDNNNRYWLTLAKGTYGLLLIFK